MTAEFARVNKTQNAKQWTAKGRFLTEICILYFKYYVCSVKWDFALLPCVVTKPTRSRGTTSLTWRHPQWPRVLSADSSTWKWSCRNRTVPLLILQGSRSHCSTCPWCPRSPNRTHFPELQGTHWPQSSSIQLGAYEVGDVKKAVVLRVADIWLVPRLCCGFSFLCLVQQLQIKVYNIDLSSTCT